MNDGIVFDSFALLCFFGQEKNWFLVRDILRGKKFPNAKLYLCLINWGEFYYVVRRRFGHEKAQEALDLISHLPIEIVPVGEALVRLAAEVKSEYRLSYADAFCAATAKVCNASILTGVREFRSIEKIVPVCWLLSKK